MVMKLLSGYFCWLDQYPALLLQIQIGNNETHEAIICDVNHELLSQGFVRLGSRESNFSWESVLPKYVGKLGIDIPLYGFTDDPEIVSLAKTLVQASREGNVDLFNKKKPVEKQQQRLIEASTLR